MRPRAACVTGGHKSPVSLPPLWPLHIMEEEEYNPALQSERHSVLANKRAAVTKT